MRKLFIHIILFLLPILIVLLLYPVNKRLRYISLKDDCFNHGIWLHDRIFENPLPVDIAFLGSSHTINAIDDHQVETILEEKKLRVLNLGYCRLGRNMDYALLKELLLSKKPKLVVLEITETENRYSHPIFPYIATQKDVLLPALFFNRDVVKDAYTAMAFKTELIQEQLFQNNPSPAIDLHAYGFAGHADTASKELLTKFFKERHLPEKKQSSLEHAFYMAFPKAYLKKTVQLCKENKIRICFLYLPAFGTSRSIPSEMELYKTYGTVLIPPSTIFDNTSNWFDENHLNKNGTAILSQWLGEQLKAIYQ
jgi:hypothetical protein